MDVSWFLWNVKKEMFFQGVFKGLLVFVFCFFNGFYDFLVIC
jgi:hypothetical protein